MKRLIVCSLLVSAVAVAGNKSYMDNSKTMTVDCAKQPEVTIMGNKNTFTFTGTCTKVNVQGNDNTVTVASTKLLLVQGNKNTVTADATDEIRAQGNENTITWKKPIDEKQPKITDMGKTNKIDQAK
jgi:hypothetical protein